MKSLENRLYASAFVNSFGSWLTFLAIALVVKEKYGAGQVAWVFLAQTLPAILFSRALSDLVPERRQAQVYFALQFLLAANSLALCFSQRIELIYAHLFVGALLKSVSTPLFNAVVVRFVPREGLQSVFTRLGALQAGTLALAPAVGAWIKIAVSVEVLFGMDALTFVIAALVLPELWKSIAQTDTSAQSKKAVSVFNKMLSAPEGVPAPTLSALKMWLIFLGVGALLNAIEFPAFAQIEMTERHIGFTMAAWGMGSLVALIWPFSRSAFQFSAGYLLALTAFVLAPVPWVSIAAFAAGGAVSSYLSGALRARLQLSVPKDYNPLPLWAYANQLTQVLNLMAYASAGALLNVLGFGAFAGLMLFLCAWLSLATWRSPVELA